MMSGHEIKVKVLNSDNQFIRRIGYRLYNVFLLMVNSKMNAFIQNKPYIGDRIYIERVYRERFGTELDLINPKNFNEKNNWRKLYDRRSIYTLMVDKYRLKDVVKERCGDGYTFPLFGVWDKANQIDFENLPSEYVLKVNHAGGVIICRDKATFDVKHAIKELNHERKVNYFWKSREWPYRDVERKIIAEAYMGENLTDYKNYCFNGKLLYTFVWTNESREDGHKPQAFFCGAYDRQWRRTDIEIDYPSKDILYQKPDCYNEMVSIAETMSKDIPFVRVDCYCINGKPYLGEMTFFPWGGFMKFKDEKWNLKFGELEKLPYET